MSTPRTRPRHWLAVALIGVALPCAAIAARGGEFTIEQPLENAAAPLVLTSVPSEGWPDSAFDPLLVYYAPQVCETGVMEVQRWSRSRRVWEPHPQHPRVRDAGCRIEDAGGLLNELRVRCIDPQGVRRPSHWRVGADVWTPERENPCPLGRDPAGDPRPLEIRIASPAPGDVLSDAVPLAPIRGRVGLGGLDALRYELLIGIDASRPRDAQARAVLDAERAAVRKLLQVLAPSLGQVRVGLLSHAGAAARLEAPLGSDLGRLLAALDDVAPGGTPGGASFPAALELALRELTGAAGALSRPRLESQKVLLLLSDGRPALPFGEGDRNRADWERSLRAARSAQRAGVALHLFALGGRETPFSPLAHAMLRGRRGSFARIAHPDASDGWLGTLSIARFERVRIDNLTTADRPEAVELTPDGRFSALLPVADGGNRVRVTAVASDGREHSVEFDLTFERARSEAERILEEERERIRRTREALRARQMKRLELEVQTQDGAGG